jgi:hypothetical protein
MTTTNLPADPQRPVITTAQEASAALVDWFLNASGEQTQELADAHGVDARKRLASGALVRADLPRTVPR